MDRLWAPWRMAYVAPNESAVEGGCFICRAVSSSDDRRDLVAHRTALGVVILNRFPYNNGHLLVCPRTHKGTLAELTADELLDGVETIRTLIGHLSALMNPHGFNIGLNLGSAAGAGVPGHLHWHVVPRWAGDANFMTVVGDTRVIVQSLESLYDLLRERLTAAP